MPGIKEWLKRIAERAARPGLVSVHDHLSRVDARIARLEESLERLAGATIDREKHREELAYWRWLIKTEKGRASLEAPFEVTFGKWQRDRLLELARALLSTDHPSITPDLPRHDADAFIDAWCAARSVVEIGAGPYPAVAAAPRWRRAVAIDPLARSYAEEGLLPAAAGHITYLEAPGERIALPAGFADLVIIENALDHVSDPAAVLLEIRRLLAPRGLLWLLVDLSNYSDHMHPHPFNEQRLRSLFKDAGFAPLSDRLSDHKSHPHAYGEYRGLLQKLDAAAPTGAVLQPAHD
jgi:SAM-dependent methyltransferase